VVVVVVLSVLQELEDHQFPFKEMQVATESLRAMDLVVAVEQEHPGRMEMAVQGVEEMAEMDWTTP
jgi:hydrogenase/urease accessory protein HupE